MAMRFDDAEDELGETHEINVTPFIDVILVLLIIFMVAAPLATVDVKVDLPRSTAEQQPRPDKPIFLTLRADRTLALGDGTVERDALGAGLDKVTGGDKTQRVFLRADKTVAYGDLMSAMDLLRTAGYLKVALVALEKATGEQTPGQ
jgi:biopolymer transport protein ExbD